jgi:hypothetical protein
MFCETISKWRKLYKFRIILDTRGVRDGIKMDKKQSVEGSYFDNKCKKTIQKICGDKFNDLENFLIDSTDFPHPEGDHIRTVLGCNIFVISELAKPTEKVDMRLLYKANMVVNLIDRKYT